MDELIGEIELRGIFKRDKKDIRLKILSALLYFLGLSFRKTSKFMSIVLRKASECEKTIKSDEESKKAYEALMDPLMRKDVIFVANSETKRKYYIHLEHLKRQLSKRIIIR